MIHHLSQITEHLAQSSRLEEAIHGFAMYSCASGKPSRFYLGKWLPDFGISFEAALGFESDFSHHTTYGRFIADELEKGHPAHHSLLFLHHSSDYKKRFREAVGVKDQPQWQSTILMQVNPNYFVALSTEIKVVESVDNVNYFNGIRSLVTLFLKIESGQAHRETSRASAREKVSYGDEFTERQTLILRMVELGRTNADIAEQMGYSESLIRQETITIYRKLGVTGRKELKIEKPESGD